MQDEKYVVEPLQAFLDARDTHLIEEAAQLLKLEKLHLGQESADACPRPVARHQGQLGEARRGQVCFVHSKILLIKLVNWIYYRSTANPDKTVATRAAREDTRLLESLEWTRP